jgi:hypothetical protein
MVTKLQTGLPGYQGVLSSVVKRPVRETDRSSPSSADIKNAWRYTSTPLYVFIAWCLIEYRQLYIYLRELEVMRVIRKWT